MYKIKYEAHIFIDDEFTLEKPKKLSFLYKNRKKFITLIEHLIEEKFEDLRIPDFESEVEDDCLVTRLPYSYDFIKTGIIEVGHINSNIKHTIEDYLKRKYNYPEDCLIFIEWNLDDSLT